ncbi:hypothetical protein ACLKA6_011320 [Drosophila palustris]
MANRQGRKGCAGIRQRQHQRLVKVLLCWRQAMGSDPYPNPLGESTLTIWRTLCDANSKIYAENVVV